MVGIVHIHVIFADILLKDFSCLRIEAKVNDKKCLVGNSMGQVLIELSTLEGLLKEDEIVTKWFQLQTEVNYDDEDNDD